ncbi:MAG: polymerase subunit delta [Frankiales bacterium]|nr:polymerase subunit delta [Frankiales bacterium]MDX6274432.1 polymerase subunit delta [Frankiales bacterium]
MTAARERAPDLDVREVVGSDLEAGALAALASPSLFGDGCLLVLRDAQDVVKALVEEVLAQAEVATPDAPLVVTHAGGAKGKPLLDKLVASGATRIDRVKLKPGERPAFVRAELKAAGRTITEDGLRALVESLGGDCRELATACAQLASDTEGDIDAEVVGRYHSGFADASSFAVADRTVEGDVAAALEQLRYALSNGVAPVLVVSALGQGLRGIAKVAAAGGGRSFDLARTLGMPAWKIDRVRRQLGGWHPDGLATALSAVAVADGAVKGAGVDPHYALERMVLTVAAARGTAS